MECSSNAGSDRHGSDSGIGRATAVRLSADGFDVGVTWHEDEQGPQETADEIRRHGPRAELRRVDGGFMLINPSARPEQS